MNKAAEDLCRYSRWATEFDQLGPRYDAAVANLKSVYEEFKSKLVAALTEAVAVDAEVHRLARNKPYHLPQTNGDGRGLPKRGARLLVDDRSQVAQVQIS